MTEKLQEGLRPLDLKEMVHNTFEIDSYRSKMGEDKDVCVLSFKVKDRAPARDLMEFIEKGYGFVLDSDVSSGEDENGEYSVFVELPRTKDLAEQIKELTYGVQRLTGVKDFKFKYYRDNSISEVNEEALKRAIPSTPSAYVYMLHQQKVNEVKTFFSKTLMDDLSIDDSVITIYKPFGVKVKLKWLSEDDPQAIVESSPSVDEQSTAETFWLTKVLGDYNISKFGDKFLFTNGDRAMLLQRID